VDIVAHRLLDGLGPVTGLGHDLEVGFCVEDEAKSTPDDRMVVRKHNPRL
jgi:hypothetical protein